MTHFGTQPQKLKKKLFAFSHRYSKGGWTLFHKPLSDKCTLDDVTSTVDVHTLKSEFFEVSNPFLVIKRYNLNSNPVLGKYDHIFPTQCWLNRSS